MTALCRRSMRRSAAVNLLQAVHSVSIANLKLLMLASITPKQLFLGLEELLWISQLWEGAWRFGEPEHSVSTSVTTLARRVTRSL